VRVSINTWLVKVGLVISLNHEHGTGMDCIASEPATHPMTQVGYTTVSVVVDKRKNTTVLVICLSG
jgi:hypothetical protein